jgi:hypothetical protein
MLSSRLWAGFRSWARWSFAPFTAVCDALFLRRTPPPRPTCARFAAPPRLEWLEGREAPDDLTGTAVTALAVGQAPAPPSWPP